MYSLYWFSSSPMVRLFFFFFKQKTAYEVTEGDWSSDVCSSDLPSRWRSANGEYASRPIASEKGADDEALGRGADIVEGIAGHERQRPRAGRIQDGDVRRVDHPRALHAIDLLSVERFELDLVARNDVLEPSEEAVTMSGDA